MQHGVVIMTTKDESKLVKLTKILFVTFIAILSVCICAKQISNLHFYSDSLERLEKSKDTVIEFSAAALAVSVGITLLPDDIASSLAQTISDISKYCVVILGMIFLEKLMVVEGSTLAFLYIIPAACILYALFVLTNKTVLKEFAKKLFILALMMILVVPLSTTLADNISVKYMEYVDDTISDAKLGTDKINEITTGSNEDQKWYERVSGVFKTSISDINELFQYFSDIVERCINSVAILLVVSFAIPFLSCAFFVWLLNQLFQLQPSVQYITNITNKISGKKEETDEEERI